MRKKKTITLATKPTYQGYSHAFKMAIVERVENGQLSRNQAAKEYDVRRGSIHKWVKKYGNLDKKLRNMGGKSPEQKIKELQKQLTEQKKLVRFWEAAMEIIEDEFKVDVKKKYLTEYQRNELRKIENRSKK